MSLTAQEFAKIKEKAEGYQKDMLAQFKDPAKLLSDLEKNGKKRKIAE